MSSENEYSMMAKVNNDVASVQGQIDRIQTDLNKIKKDPRHARRAKELEMQLHKLKRAQFRQWNQK